MRFWWKVRENVLKDDPFAPLGTGDHRDVQRARQMRGSLRFPVDLGDSEPNCWRTAGRNRQQHYDPILMFHLIEIILYGLCISSCFSILIF